MRSVRQCESAFYKRVVHLLLLLLRLFRRWRQNTGHWVVDSVFVSHRTLPTDRGGQVSMLSLLIKIVASTCHTLHALHTNATNYFNALSVSWAHVEKLVTNWCYGNRIISVSKQRRKTTKRNENWKILMQMRRIKKEADQYAARGVRMKGR